MRCCVLSESINFQVLIRPALSPDVKLHPSFAYHFTQNTSTHLSVFIFTWCWCKNLITLQYLVNNLGRNLLVLYTNITKD